MKGMFGKGIFVVVAAICLAVAGVTTSSANSTSAIPSANASAHFLPAGSIVAESLHLEPVTDPGLLAQRPMNVSASASLYVLRSGAGSNLCLDADTATLGSNGTKIQLWTCSYQAPGWPASNQLWWLSTRDPGALSSTFIQSNVSGRCLDADRSAPIGQNGVKVQLWDCVSSDFTEWKALNQIWGWDPYQPNQLVNHWHWTCLNADGNTLRTKVHLWSCSDGGARDQWYPGL
ncbi:ricin-type beta-trefoil lectin domain protein [Microbispora sp. RL4-1S]|uniref:Ricin-type beta-trefoil lectin domain protein n=1 Tax=Microbispora oryzae TaxID=2806554 RepID=A0A941AHY0_9ACTN|nr:RICIN domain-containing protein [Microbispora oryzae]MBP2703197.1 ricin-type beta-trefoil lectin domain protein [Microbispora oryzae]